MNRKIALSNLKNKINILPENATVNGAIKKEKDIKVRFCILMQECVFPN